MVEQHYRWDFVGLSTDTKPTPATSEKVVDGSTFYCSDTSKLYVYCTDDWYERKPLGGGGGGTTYTAGDGIDITDDTISVDTDTIQEKLTAGTGIDITDNTISATGGGGEAIKTLTTDDYNYPTDNPNRIALPLLEEGFYVVESDVYVQEDANRLGRESKLYYVSNVGAQGYNYIWVFEPQALPSTQSAYPIYYYAGNPLNGNLTYKKTIMSEEYYAWYYGLLQGSSAPSSSTTANSVGQMYLDNTTQKVYMCTNTTGGVYTWKEINLT